MRSYRGTVAVPPGDGLATAVRLAAALLGLAVIGVYLSIALSRLTYPFTIEWLESNSLVEVHRILSGQQLYPAPGVGYVPDGYPPLYFAVSAAVAAVLGPSYLPLRLVSLVSSLACFALLGRLVQRETGSAGAGTGRRAYWRRPTSPPVPGSTSDGSTRCSSRSAWPGFTPGDGCVAPGAPSRPGCCSPPPSSPSRTGWRKVSPSWRRWRPARAGGWPCRPR